MFHVERAASNGLVVVHHEPRTDFVRRHRERWKVESVTVLVTDVRDREQAQIVIEDPLEGVGWDFLVCVCVNPADGAATGHLRVPEIRDRGKRKVIEADRVPSSPVDSGRNGCEASRRRPDDSDLVWTCPNEPCEGGFELFVLLHPEVPRRAECPPALEVLLVRRDRAQRRAPLEFVARWIFDSKIGNCFRNSRTSGGVLRVEAKMGRS